MQIGSFLAALICVGLIISDADGQYKARAAIDLKPFGLRPDAFRLDTPKSCAAQYKSYRYVLWLTADIVAVVFNTSPTCLSKAAPVNGLVKAITFRVSGKKLGEVTLPYEAGHGGSIRLGDGAWAGPDGSLVIGTSAEKESSSTLHLFTTDLQRLQDVELPYGQALMGVTPVQHALVLKRFTPKGADTEFEYLRTSKLEVKETWRIESGRNRIHFGDSAASWPNCDAKLKTVTHGKTSVSSIDGPIMCSVEVSMLDKNNWNISLSPGEFPDIIEVLPDNSVVAVVSGAKAERLSIFSDKGEVALPWESLNGRDPLFAGETRMFERYATYQTGDGPICENFGRLCSRDGIFLVWDRSSAKPILRRKFPKNGRAALSPDGHRYASLEDGQLRFYDLP